MDQEKGNNLHDKFAPYWAAALVIFGGIGLSTIWIDLGSFWKGYVLDITGPAWNYILFRGLFTTKANNAWTRFFTPGRTFFIFALVCVGIETLQYFNVYESTYDPRDFLAYFFMLVPVFLTDLIIVRQAGKRSNLI